MKPLLLLLPLPALLAIGCIQDDYVLDAVPESVRITNPIDSLALGGSYAFEATYFNNIGQAESQPLLWESSDAEVLAIDADGQATAVSVGAVTLSVSVELPDQSSVSDQLELVVAEEVGGGGDDFRSGTIQSTSSYTLQGSFTLRETESGLLLEFADDYLASSNLPGLYVYLTNNPNSVANAFEIGMVQVFDGAHEYALPAGIGLLDYDYLLYYCKPFGVKVGDGAID